MQSQLQKMGVKTVYKTIYPAETTDMTPIVAKAIAKKPDMIVAGTQSRGRVRSGEGARTGELQPEVPLLRQRRQLADRVPEQGRQEQRQRHLQLQRLDARRADEREQAVRGRSTSRSTAATSSTSTTTRRRPGRSGSCSSSSSRRPARSTTRRSSTRSTRASGRRSRGTSPGTRTARRTATTCSSSGSTASCCPCSRRRSPSRSRSPRSRPGAGRPEAGTRRPRCTSSSRPASWACSPAGSTP